MTLGRDLFGGLDYISMRGKRVSLSLRFVGMNPMPADSRNMYLYTFEDEERNSFKWFTDALKQLEIGKTYKVNATVGKPKRFRDQIETRLKGCRILPAPAQEAGERRG